MYYVTLGNRRLQTGTSIYIYIQNISIMAYLAYNIHVHAYSVFTGDKENIYI